MKLTQTERLIVALRERPRTTDELYDPNGLNIPNYKGRKFDATKLGCGIEVEHAGQDNNLHRYTMTYEPEWVAEKIDAKLEALGSPHLPKTKIYTDRAKHESVLSGRQFQDKTGKKTLCINCLTEFATGSWLFGKCESCDKSTKVVTQ